jgi:hypothetical protein
MKKMLFIGAMLVVGMTAFGGRVVDLGPANPSQPVSGDTSLGIITKGEVVDKTKEVLLVVKPTLSAGDDETSLHFRFGDMKAGTGKEVDGEFTVQVLNKGEAVDMGNALAVKLKKPGGTDLGATEDIKLYKTNAPELSDTHKMGTIRYTLTGQKENSGKLYTGRVVSNVKLDADKTGSFADSSCYIDIAITNLNIPAGN